MSAFHLAENVPDDDIFRSLNKCEHFYHQFSTKTIGQFFHLILRVF